MNTQNLRADLMGPDHGVIVSQFESGSAKIDRTVRKTYDYRADFEEHHNERIPVVLYEIEAPYSRLLIKMWGFCMVRSDLRPASASAANNGRSWEIILLATHRDAVAEDPDAVLAGMDQLMKVSIDLVRRRRHPRASVVTMERPAARLVPTLLANDFVQSDIDDDYWNCDLDSRQ
jgi:hypothetical protein